MSTKARYKLGRLPLGCMIYVMIQRMDPIQSKMANQFVIYFKNLIQAGVFSLSGSLLSPYYMFLLAAASLESPVSTLEPNLLSNSSKGILCSSIFCILSAFSFIFRSYCYFSSFGLSELDQYVPMGACLGLGTLASSPRDRRDVFLE